jgi:hypothetical protein
MSETLSRSKRNHPTLTTSVVQHRSFHSTFYPHAIRTHVPSHLWPPSPPPPPPPPPPLRCDCVTLRGIILKAEDRLYLRQKVLTY